jgi:hypothetical protein
MREGMIERESNDDTSKAPHQPDQSRVLTYDEIKAAEAAFRGEPFNPAWCAAAAHIYAGIAGALANRERATQSQAVADSEYIPC